MKYATLFILAGLLVTASHAADTAKGLGRNGPCKADIEKLCPGVAPGGGRIIACLKQNKAQVSDACQTALEKLRDRKPGNNSGDSSKE